MAGRGRSGRSSPRVRGGLGSGQGRPGSRSRGDPRCKHGRLAARTLGTGRLQRDGTGTEVTGGHRVRLYPRRGAGAGSSLAAIRE